MTVRNRPPSAVLTLGAPSVPVGASIFLDGTASSDPDGHVIRYQWDLDGDGSLETDTGGSGVTLSRPFLTPRTATIRLRVTDDLGATAETTAPLTVFQPGLVTPTKQCLQAKAKVRKLATSIRKLRRQVGHAHGARRRALTRKLSRTRKQLSRARVRVKTIC